MIMENVKDSIDISVARCSDGSNSAKNKTHEPRIAYVDEGNIYIEKLERDVLADIRI